MSISFGAKGTTGYGTTGASASFPTGITAGDLLVLVVAMREGVGSVRQPAGWNEVAEFTGTTGTAGVDTGPTRISVFTKRATGSESGSLSVLLASGTASWADIYRFSSSTGDFYVEAFGGQDSTDDTSFGVSITPPARVPVGWLAPGDMVLGLGVIASDTPTWSSESFTSAGLTFGSVAEIAEYTTANGNDMGGAAWYATVASGTQTSKDLTLAATLSGASYGPAIALRIRDTLAADSTAPTLVGQGFGRPTGGTTLTLGVPAGVKDGDLLLYGITYSGATTEFSDETSKGWWTVIDDSVGTRRYVVLARLYAASDAASTYVLTLGSSTSPAVAVAAFRDHDVASVSDLQIGSANERASTVATSTAPSITTTKNNSIALAFLFEATNSLGYWTQSSGDFQLLVEKVEQPVASASIEQVQVMQKRMASPGATGNVVLDYTVTSTNGAGLQISFAKSGSPTSPHGSATTAVAAAPTAAGTVAAGRHGSATASVQADSLSAYGASGGVGPIPTRVGTAVGPGGQTFTLTLPTGIQNGDLLLAVIEQGAAADLDETTKGWTRLFMPVAMGTRTLRVIARLYNSSDSSSDYTLTTSVNASCAWITSAVRNHGVVTMTDIIVGSRWRRADNGGAQGLVVMPSITTTKNNTLVLGFTGEATTAASTWSVTTDGGFTLWAERVENSNIETATEFYKGVATAGASGDHSITYTVTTVTNGAGVQIGIPPKALSGAPTGSATTGAAAAVSASGAAPNSPVGLIGAHAALNPSSNSVTIGLDKIAGASPTTVVLYAADGTTELARTNVTTDVTSGWGNAQFGSLDPNTVYNVKFEVGGIQQTDVGITVRTLPVGATSFKAVTGSCQFTGSNHLIWDKINAVDPLFVAHMGDLHYADATTFSAWLTAMQSSLTATRVKNLLETTFFNWAYDNHDRIITNPGGDPALGLNLGETDPAGMTEWKKFAGNTGWSSADTIGRTWVAGRVRFIQTDGWTVRDDPDFDAEPRTFLGATQKQWFKDTLDAATEPLIIWLCQQTGRNNANGRWASFPSETTELENFINARPLLKKRMVLIGGDSHSLQADSGSTNALRAASPSYRFKGIPNLNISGFDRNGGTTGDAGQAGEWNIANTGLADGDTVSNFWGGYSRLTFTDDGTNVNFLWEGVRVSNVTGAEEVMAIFERNYGESHGDATTAVAAAPTASGKSSRRGEAYVVANAASTASGTRTSRAAATATVTAAVAAHGVRPTVIIPRGSGTATATATPAALGHAPDETQRRGSGQASVATTVAAVGRSDRRGGAAVGVAAAPLAVSGPRNAGSGVSLSLADLYLEPLWRGVRLTRD